MIVLASSKARLRRRWKQALQGMPAIHETTTRADLERCLAKLKPTVLLLDLGLPKIGGADGVRAIQRLSPLTRIVILTGAPHEQEGVSALKAGARGYCHTDIAPVLLKKAVEMVKKGEIWVGRMLIPHLLHELTSVTERRRKISPVSSDSRLEGLTPRQREVVHLIGSGASNKEIASRLNITEGTVKAHLTAVFRKVGLSDRLQLALFVMERMGASR